MAKQVMILIVCNWCKKKWQDQDPEAPVEIPWSWNGTDYLSELCGECREKITNEHVNPLITASEQHKRKLGRPVGSKTKLPGKARNTMEKYKNKDGEYACPYPGCGNTYTFPQHLGNHYRSHGECLSDV